MSEHQQGALDALEEVATALDAHIRVAAEVMLEIQERTRALAAEHGTFGEETIKAVIEMACARGYFDGLVKAWELAKQDKYPLEVVESRWLS